MNAHRYQGTLNPILNSTQLEYPSADGADVRNVTKSYDGGDLVVSAKLPENPAAEGRDEEVYTCIFGFLQTSRSEVFEAAFNGWRNTGNHTYWPENPGYSVQYVEDIGSQVRVLDTGFTMYEGLNRAGAVTVNKFGSGAPPLEEINSTDLEKYGPVNDGSASLSSNLFAAFPEGGVGGGTSGSAQTRNPLAIFE